MKTRILSLVMMAMISLMAVADEPFTEVTDLYYGTAYTKYYNHQLWFTSAGLTYDPVNSQIAGTDGNVMRLDLMCPSATDIAGTYEIVGPNYADAAYKMNKKFTYWTNFVNGSFYDYKLTVGTCTITCTSTETYTMTYNVQEIDNGPVHQGTITNFRIKAVTEQGASYTLVPSCTNAPAAVEETEAENSGRVRKTIENGRLVLTLDGVRYDAMGRRL